MRLLILVNVPPINNNIFQQIYANFSPNSDLKLIILILNMPSYIYCMKHFKFYNKTDIASLTKQRKFETKIGERLQSLPAGEWPNVLQANKANFVLLGIPEDIGVRANLGQGGADTNWHSFLESFVNMQSNDFCSGEDVLLLGHFDFGDVKYLIENNAFNEQEKLEALRHAVQMIDDEVETLVKAIAFAGKTAIVIGGGHNNAYPLLKSYAKGLHKNGTIPLAQINVVNLDAHTDYRTMEGRHSGNAFRYAEHDGFIEKYSIIGVHESYMPQNVLTDTMENPFIQFTSFEDIFIRESKTFQQALIQAGNFVKENYCGIELDMDAIENTLSSAVAPTGVSSLQARKYVSFMAKHTNAAYLHIAEAAQQLQDGRKQETVGKLLAYLVTDFVKAVNEK
jgi:formiminoglutamase